MNSPRSLAAWLICFSLGLFSVAHATAAPKRSSSDQTSDPADLKTMIAAQIFRAEMAANVANGTEKADDAIIRLETQDAPNGVRIDPDADVAFAANDIGLRLIVTHNQPEALKFFNEAEKRLTAAIQRTPDQSAGSKAQFLGVRADLRARYLKQPVAAKDDIMEALRLDPQNVDLQRLLLVLESGRAEYFKETAQH